MDVCSRGYGYAHHKVAGERSVRDLRQLRVRVNCIMVMVMVRVRVRVNCMKGTYTTVKGSVTTQI